MKCRASSFNISIYLHFPPVTNTLHWPPTKNAAFLFHRSYIGLTTANKDRIYLNIASKLHLSPCINHMEMTIAFFSSAFSWSIISLFHVANSKTRIAGEVLPTKHFLTLPKESKQKLSQLPYYCLKHVKGPNFLYTLTSLVQLQFKIQSPNLAQNKLLNVLFVFLTHSKAAGLIIIQNLSTLSIFFPLEKGTINHQTLSSSLFT